jgi:hypothetical protein
MLLGFMKGLKLPKEKVLPSFAGKQAAVGETLDRLRLPTHNHTCASAAQIGWPATPVQSCVP